MSDIILYTGGRKVPGEMMLLNRRVMATLSEAQGIMEKKLWKYLSSPDYKVYLIDIETLSGERQYSFVLGVLKEDLSYKFVKGSSAIDGTKLKLEKEFSAWETLSPKAREEFEEIHAAAVASSEGEGEHGLK